MNTNITVCFKVKWKLDSYWPYLFVQYTFIEYLLCFITSSGESPAWSLSSFDFQLPLRPSCLFLNPLALPLVLVLSILQLPLVVPPFPSLGPISNGSFVYSTIWQQWSSVPGLDSSNSRFKLLLPPGGLQGTSQAYKTQHVQIWAHSPSPQIHSCSNLPYHYFGAAQAGVLNAIFDSSIFSTPNPFNQLAPLVQSPK